MQDIMEGIKELNTHHVEYSGQMLKGMKEGKGSKYYKHTGGDFYHGSWLADKRHGHGIIYFGKNTQLNVFDSSAEKLDNQM